MNNGTYPNVKYKYLRETYLIDFCLLDYQTNPDDILWGQEAEKTAHV